MKGEGGDKARAAASGISSGDNPLLAGTKFDPFAANGEEVSRASGQMILPCLCVLCCTCIVLCPSGSFPAP